MRDDKAKIVADVADEDLQLAYVLACLRIEAGKAAAALLAAATEHADKYGPGDTWTLAAVEASEALADIASDFSVDQVLRRGGERV